MNAFNEFWQRFDGRARTGLAAGTLLIAGATVWAGASLLRTDYQVLFADLGQQDAATMTAELDKMKTPYRLGGNGSTILVPADQVYTTRLKLVGKELPLRGAVGLELFNSSEVGMTEFTQKVNYQRALQGELTRTIMALDEVQNVRVHLVLAEQGLFKKSQKQAKASISLTLKPGRALDAGQVQGMQRLVSAAVPDIRPADVTITDQHGLALTRRAAEGEDAPAGDQLDDKRAIEQYLQRKVADVLERTFGAGVAIATVDVTLSRDHSKVTTESVLGGRSQDGNGVLVRERVTSRDPASAAPADGAAAPAANTVNRESDYQVGRRVEQVVSAAGAVSRINVAVVVRGVRDQYQLDRIKDLVSQAAGVSGTRGDGVSVYSMDQVAGFPGDLAPAAAAQPGAAADGAATAQARGATGAADAGAPAADSGNLIAQGRNTPAAAPAGNATLAAMVLAALAGSVLLAAVWNALRRKPAPRQLSLAERQAVLLQVNQWLAQQPRERQEQD